MFVIYRVSEFSTIFINRFQRHMRQCQPTKCVGGACHQQSRLIWTTYWWSFMKHDQRDLKAACLRHFNFRNIFCSF